MFGGSGSGEMILTLSWNEELREYCQLIDGVGSIVCDFPY
jgi:hypothetical protein